MKTILITLAAIIISLTGCIRHSDDGLQRRERKKDPEKTVNLKRITPNLMVGNIDSTIQFYSSVLGFEVVTAFPDTGRMDFAIMSLDSLDIMFQQKESFIEELGGFQQTQPGGSFTIHIDVKDVLMIYEKAVLNAGLVQELHQTPYGTKEFSMKDNNGYVLTFSEPLR